MRFSTELVLAACIGAAMAGPTHRHLHRNVHAKKDIKDVDWKALDWDNMGINWSSAWAAGQHTSTTAAPVPTPTDAPIIAAAKVTTTSAPAVVSSTTSSSAAAASTSAASLISEVKTLFSSIKGLANDIESFGAATAVSGSEVAAIGNIGLPQGSNMMKVASPGSYDFTNTFINTSNEPITVVIWNKAYSPSGLVADAEANLGSCVALSTPALSFTLAVNGQQTVAFMDQSLIGWAQATSSITPAGAPDTTWGEAKFTSTAGCGYDVSSIVNSKGNTYDMSISSLETTCVSDPTQNDWIAENGNPETPIPIGSSDGSCYIPGGKATLTTKMGGSTV